MKLEQLSSQAVVVVSVDDPVNLAIQHMWELNIRHLPVVRGNVPVGMISERDVLFHVCWLDHTESSLVGDRKSPASGASRMDQIMTSPAVVLAPDDPAEKAARLMLNKKISSVPLVTNNRIVGIVTETDFLKCYNDAARLVPSMRCRKRSVADLMSAHVFSVRPTDGTLSAIRLMRDKQVRHVPVMDHNRLVGIISDRDVLRGSPRKVGEEAVSVRDFHVANDTQVLAS